MFCFFAAVSSRFDRLVSPNISNFLGSSVEGKWLNLSGPDSWSGNSGGWYLLLVFLEWSRAEDFGCFVPMQVLGFLAAESKGI